MTAINNETPRQFAGPQFGAGEQGMRNGIDIAEKRVADRSWAPMKTDIKKRVSWGFGGLVRKSLAPYAYLSTLSLQ